MDDLAKKDWCHTKIFLRYISMDVWNFVQVMCHALMTSSMTSPCPREGEVLKLPWQKTRPVFIVAQQRNTYCYNLWLTGHLSDAIKFQFRFQFKRLSEVENQNFFSWFFLICFRSRMFTAHNTFMLFIYSYPPGLFTGAIVWEIS